MKKSTFNTLLVGGGFLLGTDGIKLLTTKDGRFTNAIVGFMNILLKLEAAHQRPGQERLRAGYRVRHAHQERLPGHGRAGQG